MNKSLLLPELRMIPLDRIEVLNPRERNQRKFTAIVENIGAIGLKKPVTVTPRTGEDGAFWCVGKVVLRHSSSWERLISQRW